MARLRAFAATLAGMLVPALIVFVDVGRRWQL